MTPPAIETDGLSKQYGETVALDALNMTVAQGEVYGFLGRTVPASRPRSIY